MGESDSKKGVGVFGAGIAAIGLLLSKGADDCARIGAKGASMSAPVRGAAGFGDDALRAGGHAAGFGDDALRAGGHAAGFGDDALRAGGHAPHLTPGLLDDTLGGAARGSKSAGEAIAEEGFGLTIDIASLALPDGSEMDDDSAPSLPQSRSGGAPELPRKEVSGSGDTEPLRAASRLLVENPSTIALVPTSVEAFKRFFGRPGSTQEIEAMIHVAEQSNQQADAKEIGIKTLGTMLAERRASNPVTIIGYTAGENSRIKLPSGEQITDAEIHQACSKFGMSCLVFACNPGRLESVEPCARSAQRIWMTASKKVEWLKGTTPMVTFVRALLKERSGHPAGPAMVFSRVQLSSKGVPQVIRSHSRSGTDTPSVAP